MQRRQLRAYIDDAEKFEYEEKRRPALSRYRQALYFLHKECSLDATTDATIASIETRITGLGGKATKLPAPIELAREL